MSERRVRLQHALLTPEDLPEGWALDAGTTDAAPDYLAFSGPGEMRGFVAVSSTGVDAASARRFMTYLRGVAARIQDARPLPSPPLGDECVAFLRTERVSQAIVIEECTVVWRRASHLARLSISAPGAPTGVTHDPTALASTATTLAARVDARLSTLGT